MTVCMRSYKLLADFEPVYEFLGSIYSLDELNGCLLPEFFEYAHTHPAFNHKLTHRFGLWEDGGRIAGIACYEMDLGECLWAAGKDCKHLLPDMLAHSERELCKTHGGVSRLGVWITSQQTEKRALLIQNGYSMAYSEPVNIFRYDIPFREVCLPEGFSVISLEDENDFRKINDCLWKGFDHGDTPDDDLDCRMLMQSGPRFRKDLTTVIKAPNGEYACFAGMWLNDTNQYAYLEPLATAPAYRRMGLATVALTEGMKKTKALGAKYCFGGSREFYFAIGFETVCSRELWRKEWKR